MITFEELKNEGSKIPGDCGNPMGTPPAWMDFDRFNRGRQFFIKHIGVMLFAVHCSLTVGFGLTNILEALVHTENSNTPRKSFNRYYKTFLHMASWHIEDVWDAPHGKGHKSVKMVRNLHNSVARSMNKKGGDHLYFSQYDMALIQHGFSAAAIMYPEGFGLKCTRDELEDYILFWRGIGYLLGIDDRFNICQGNLDDFRAIGKKIEVEALEALNKKPKHPDIDPMADAYIDGLNQNFIKWELMSKESLAAFIYDTFGHQNMMPKLGFLDTLRFYFYKSQVFMVTWIPFLEPIGNNFMMFIGYRNFDFEKKQY